MKNDFLLPIHDVGGMPSWNVPVSYKCSKCGSFVSSVDGRVLHQLPGDVASGYPVDPRYAGKGSKFHMTIGLTSRMAQDFETTSNGNCVSVDLHELASDEYHRRQLRYLQSLTRHEHSSPPPPFVSFNQFVGCALPSPTVLRDRYAAALSSTLTVSGMSDNDRHDREIQSVGCKVGYAEDHTFEAVKNWRLRSSSGGACIWDVATETGEIACFVITPSSKQEHYAHAAEALVRRPNFNPKGKWSDICPKGAAFFSMLHGEGFQQRLGMFHFIARIVDTLDPLHPDYYHAIRDLEACVWEVDQSTEAAVKRSLQDGSMNGKKHTDQEINALYYSSSWKERYSQYICRYPIADGETINDNLDRWRVNYKVEASPGAPPGRGREVNGRRLFTSATKDAVENCKKVSGHLQDFVPRDDMYIKMNRSSRSSGLPIMRNGRPESNLEKSHLELAGYSNGGMRDSLADGITKRGICRSNKRIRTALRVGSLSPKEIDGIPSHLRNHPGTCDDTIKIEENRLAKDLGMALPNDETILQKYPPNNGEEFGSAYFYSEIERKKKFAPVPDSVRCPCDRCGGNPVQLSHLQQHLPRDSSLPEIEEASGKLAVHEAPAASYLSYSYPCPVMALADQLPPPPPPPPPMPIGYYGHYGYCYPHVYSYPPYMHQPSMPDCNQPEPKRRKVAKERSPCCTTHRDEYLHLEAHERKKGAPRHCYDCPTRSAIREKKKATRRESSGR